LHDHKSSHFPHLKYSPSSIVYIVISVFYIIIKMAKRLPLIILLWFCTDLYFYQALHTFTGSADYLWIYWVIDLALIAGLVAVIFVRRGSQVQQRLITWVMGLMLLAFIPRLFSVPVLLIEDLSRLFRGFPPRRVWVSELALGISAVLFLVVLFGITRGRHFYRLRRETLWFPDLPEAFDGFTITQITDVHSGSFTNAAGVQKGLDLVNDQQSDVILFTGDLVNNRASEMDQWIPAFAGLNAPMGKFSILGNHDYGDYIQWENAEAKLENLNRLKQVHSEIGFRLLLDEAVTLKKDDQSIALIGVENWGKGGFHKYGDLKKATAQVNGDAFRVLMAHDPSHWEGVTLQHEPPIHLTLSGHTHGMQFGIDFLGFKWSPIQYVYKQWAGLYQDAGRYLYVNRGFGFLGLKGRIGMWPEVAVITLKRRGIFPGRD
jgi:predicted MPP superfamily phosphohydrolase